jgi:4a-hydroxytetrahydrobiopterin dehydratase
VYDPVKDSEAIDEEMRKLKAGFWTLAEDKKSISSSFTCRHFKAAVAFINAAAEIAERADMNHHPDLHLTSYRNIEVKVCTHAAGGLTKFDFKLARELDGIEVDYSPAWLKKVQASIDAKP